MSLEAANFGPGFDVPESGCPIATAGEQRGAIRGEGHALDSTENPSFMSLEAANFGPGFGVPKPGYPVITAGEQCGAVRGEGHACDEI